MNRLKDRKKAHKYASGLAKFRNQTFVKRGDTSRLTPELRCLMCVSAVSISRQALMHHPGYHWTICPQGGQWRWSIHDQDNGRVVVDGWARSRSHAAAYVVRAIARGVTAEAVAQDLAA